MEVQSNSYIMYTYQETKDASVLKHHIHALWPWLSFSNSVWAYPLFEVLKTLLQFIAMKKITHCLLKEKRRRRNLISFLKRGM
jgi:hypothetical protein